MPSSKTLALINAGCLLPLLSKTIKTMHNLIIFASGNGTNASAIIDFYRKNRKARVVLIVCNNPNAGVIDLAKKEEVPFLIITKETFHGTLLLEQLSSFRPSLIILAGFLWKLPPAIIHQYPDKIINIHPALLPAYGGKGMYGHFVHDKVIAGKEKESGITVHYVTEQYDKGNIIMQARCKVLQNDDATKLAKRIQKLEHFYYPRVIEFLLKI